MTSATERVAVMLLTGGFYSYRLPAELCDRFSRDVMPLMPLRPGRAAYYRS